MPLHLVQRRGETFAMQRYVEGATPVRSLSPAQLGDATIVHSLCRFWDAVQQGWAAGGWLPDIGGRVYLPGDLYRPLRTDNVVVDDMGSCWLVDFGAGAVFHSARSPFGRLHAALMLRAIRRCMGRFGCPPGGPCP